MWALTDLRPDDGSDLAPSLSGLTTFERCLGAYVASTIRQDGDRARELAQHLYELDASHKPLDQSEPDRGSTFRARRRIDVIVAYATKLTRRPGRIKARDVEQLHAVGLSPLDIIDLEHVVANHGEDAHEAEGPELAHEVTVETRERVGSAAAAR